MNERIFEFDDLYIIAMQIERTNPAKAARLYQAIASMYGNEKWMSTRAANAWLSASCFDRALALIYKYDDSVALKLIKARCYRGKGMIRRAIKKYKECVDVLNN